VRLRHCLVTFVLLLCGASGLLASSREGAVDRKIDAARDAQIKSVQELIRIKSYNHGSATTPSEGVKKALDYTLELGRRMGFRTFKHPEYRFGYVEAGPENAPEMVMALVHLDTVPEGNPKLWTLAGPFEGKIVDGKIIGRGAFDDKGPAVASMYALKAINDAGVPLSRRIRIFFGTSEDGSGNDGKSWSCVAEYAKLCKEGKEEWPTLGFSPDSGRFAVTYLEKAGVNVAGRLSVDTSKAIRLASLKGGSARNAVSDQCSAILEAADEKSAKSLVSSISAALADQPWKGDVKIRNIGKEVFIDVAGVAAHSGQAWKGRNANARMLFILSKAGAGESWGAHASKLVDLVGVDTADGKALGIKQGEHKVDNNITVNMGLVELKNTGTVPELTFHVNIRYPDKGADLKVPSVKHFTGQEIKEKVEAAFKTKGFSIGEGKEVHVTGGGKPYTIPWDSEIVVTLRAAYKGVTGKDREPVISYGGTYASAWQNEPVDEKGTVFGYRMAAWGIEGGSGMHEPNESLSIKGMMEGTKILARAMAILGGVK
jgi:succinyl-diaminopimelate desuccinylase